MFLRPNIELASRLAHEANAAGDPLGWFEPFYRDAAEREGFLPWDDREPNRNLLDWLASRGSSIAGRNVLVAGCGLGDDAAELARRRAAVTAFDISPAAITWARKRFGASGVRFEVADVTSLPSRYDAAFDLIVEINTLQVLPKALRPASIAQLVRAAAPGGEILTIARGGEDDAPFGTLPWPVSERDLETFAHLGCSRVSFEDFTDPYSGSRRLRAVFRRK